MTKLALSARFAGVLFIVLLILTANLEVRAVRTVSSAPPYKISAIKAMLFYDGKGTFSRDVLAKPDFTFWNTIIGEGDAEGPSNSTLVLVEVTGNPSPNDPSPSRKIEFTAVAYNNISINNSL